MIIIIFIISFFFTNVAFAKPQESENTVSQNLNNIALCYHGFTTNEAEKSEYVSYLQDFQEQVNYLKDKGYTFVPPSKYNQWYSKKYTPDTPIATIIFDDARESVDIAAYWLVENEIPFGIAIIGRRLGTINPEEGYMSWAAIKRLYDTEYCEILSHTYNMHHFDLKNQDSAVVSAPILEGPSYVDNGDFLYIDSDDTRWYWDLTHIDDTTWSFPLFGTDRKTSQPITSTIKFKAKESVTVNKMRAWAALHSPYSSGYDVAIKIDIDGTEVANKTINTIQYETRSQWPEREFVTIDFDNSYTLEANKTYTMTFATQSAGNSSFNIYSIPNFSGDYELTTTSTGMSYGAQEKWPAQACIILAGDNGKEATVKEFEQYVFDDLSMNSKVINKYLSASWYTNTTGFEENETLECIVLGGTYPDGSKANTDIKFTPSKSFTGEVLRFKTVSHLGDWYPLIIDIYINDQKVSRFSSNWQDWSSQTVNINPYQFKEGQEYNITFKTANTSPTGTGLVRIYMDQQALPWPTWDSVNDTWAQPADSEFQYVPQYKVSSSEGTDVYPSGINIDKYEHTWEYSSPYTGPGKAFLEILSSTSGASVTPTQICYPFGAYYSKQTNNKQHIDPILKNILKKIGMDSGMAVWDEAARSLEDIQSEYSEYIIPRYLVLGNLEQSQIFNDIDILTGPS